MPNHPWSHSHKVRVVGDLMLVNSEFERGHGGRGVSIFGVQILEHGGVFPVAQPEEVVGEAIAENNAHAMPNVIQISGYKASEAQQAVRAAANCLTGRTRLPSRGRPRRTRDSGTTARTRIRAT